MVGIYFTFLLDMQKINIDWRRRDIYVENGFTTDFNRGNYITNLGF